MYMCIGLPEAEPRQPFSLGPVSFVPLEQFLAGPGGHFSATEREAFNGLNWIVGLDAGSQTFSDYERKRLVDAACDLLRTLLPSDWTQRFAWRYPHQNSRYRSVVFCDRQGNLTADRDRYYELVTAPAHWLQELLGDGAAFVEAAGEVMRNALVDQNREKLGSRVLDAARWYCSALDDDLPGAKVVKLCTAVERMLRPSSSSGGADLIDKAMALVGPSSPAPLSDCKGRIERLYKGRSELSHGGRSPLDPKLDQEVYGHTATAQHIILMGTSMLNVMGMDRSDDHKRLKSAFRYIADRNANLAILRAASKADIER